MSDKRPDIATAFSSTTDVEANMEANMETNMDTPNANQRVEVTAEDLPLHCPMPGKRLWDSHPKVYLPIEDSGQALCPYCGTAYFFKGSIKSTH